MSRDDGGPAFPCWDGGINLIEGGMSLRDWFAGQALAGLIMRGFVRMESIESEAYRKADEMLAERRKP